VVRRRLAAPTWECSTVAGPRDSELTGAAGVGVEQVGVGIGGDAAAAVEEGADGVYSVRVTGGHRTDGYVPAGTLAR